MKEKLCSFNGEVIKLKYIRLAINLYKLLYLLFSKNGLCDLTLYIHYMVTVTKQLSQNFIKLCWSILQLSDISNERQASQWSRGDGFLIPFSHFFSGSLIGSKILAAVEIATETIESCSRIFVVSLVLLAS